MGTDSAAAREREDSRTGVIRPPKNVNFLTPHDLRVAIATKDGVIVLEFVPKTVISVDSYGEIR